MTKLIIKTVSITLASVLGAFLLTFGALALFSPITLAKIFDGTGGYSSSIHFYERNYDKTGDVDDLALLVVKINEDVDLDLAEDYLEQLIVHEEFNSFCEKNEQPLQTKEFYYGKYAVVLAKNAKLDKAIELGDAFVQENGYTDYNPFSVLLFEYGDFLSAEQLGSIQTKIESYSLDGVQLEKRAIDLTRIEQLKTQI